MASADHRRDGRGRAGHAAGPRGLRRPLHLPLFVWTVVEGLKRVLPALERYSPETAKPVNALAQRGLSELTAVYVFKDLIAHLTDATIVPRVALLWSSGTPGGAPSQPMFGTLLNWMQDHRHPIFCVATANDISALPPELLRWAANRCVPADRSLSRSTAGRTNHPARRPRARVLASQRRQIR